VHWINARKSLLANVVSRRCAQKGYGRAGRDSEDKAEVITHLLLLLLRLRPLDPLEPDDLEEDEPLPDDEESPESELRKSLPFFGILPRPPSRCPQRSNTANKTQTGYCEARSSLKVLLLLSHSEITLPFVCPTAAAWLEAEVGALLCVAGP
jgi:hypothetical protein